MAVILDTAIIANILITGGGQRPTQSAYYFLDIDFLDIDQIGLAELTRNVVLLATGFPALGYVVLGAGRPTISLRV